MSSPASITLNIGGKLYQTRQSTLRIYENAFVRLLDSSARNEDGHYFIDRDGKMFRHVLNFLRCGELVLPDDFKEFDLLEREADYYKITKLKQEIKSRYSGAVGLRVGGKLYRMSTEEASKHQDSFFARMLTGRTPVPRDAFGNFIIDRSARWFAHVLYFIRHNCIPGDITTEDPTRLREEEMFFDLKILDHHVDTVLFLKQISPIDQSIRIYIHLFCPTSSGDNLGQSVVYANKSKASGWFWEWHFSEICSKTYSSGTVFFGLIDEVKVGKLNVEMGIPDSSDGRYRNIINLIRKKTGVTDEQVLKLNESWSKFSFSI